jgi:hypothetical protein
VVARRAEQPCMLGAMDSEDSKKNKGQGKGKKETRGHFHDIPRSEQY